MEVCGESIRGHGWNSLARCCGGGVWPAGGRSRTGREAHAGKTIEAVLKEHTDSLMSLPGVVGTALGECSGQPCIKVFVVKKTAELVKQIPSTIEGYEVAVQETGEIRALDPS